MEIVDDLDDDKRYTDPNARHEMQSLKVFLPLLVLGFVDVQISNSLLALVDYEKVENFGLERSQQYEAKRKVVLE